MTPKPDLDEIERRLNAATPGPWRTQTAACDHPDRDEHAAVKGGGYLVVDCAEGANADLIAHAPEDLRALLAEVRTARLYGARVMRDAILRVERWSAGGVQAILDLDPAAVVGVATTVPDETVEVSNG